MKVLRPGAALHVATTGLDRLRHAIITTVTDQDTITCDVGAEAFTATRGSSTTTRGTIFTTV